MGTDRGMPGAGRGTAPALLRSEADRSASLRRRFARAAALAFTAATILVGVAQPAWAETEAPRPASLSVQQALSHLVNEPGATGASEAVMKVDEALQATDQSGVDLAELRQAKTALQRGDSARAMPLLQHSIAGALAAAKPAVGEETGTTVVAAPYAGEGPLTATQWILLGLFVLVAAVGSGLAVLLRPRENLDDLRRDILAARAAHRVLPTPTD